MESSIAKPRVGKWGKGVSLQMSSRETAKARGETPLGFLSRA